MPRAADRNRLNGWPPSAGDRVMYIAMNRFRVAKGSEAAFEQVWMSRDSHLDKVPGFIEFHLLKGPEAEDHTLYASHTVWQNHAVIGVDAEVVQRTLDGRLKISPDGT